MATARTQMMVHPSLGVHEFHYSRGRDKQTPVSLAADTYFGMIFECVEEPMISEDCGNPTSY